MYGSAAPPQRTWSVSCPVGTDWDRGRHRWQGRQTGPQRTPRDHTPSLWDTGGEQGVIRGQQVSPGVNRGHEGSSGVSKCHQGSARVTRGQQGPPRVRSAGVIRGHYRSPISTGCQHGLPKVNDGYRQSPIGIRRHQVSVIGTRSHHAITSCHQLHQAHVGVSPMWSICGRSVVKNNSSSADRLSPHSPADRLWPYRPSPAVQSRSNSDSVGSWAALPARLRHSPRPSDSGAVPSAASGGTPGRLDRPGRRPFQPNTGSSAINRRRLAY